MFSDKAIRELIAGALLIHGIAHVIALGGLVAQCLRGPSASRVAVRSWLLPSLSPKAAATAGIPFWILSAMGFLAASASFWGILVPDEVWRQLAVASAIISILGIALFFGTWPGSPNQLRSMLNTCVALAMDVAILVTQLWLRWPPQTMFGK